MTRVSGPSIAFAAVLAARLVVPADSVCAGQLVLRQAETSHADIAHTAAISGDGRLVAFVSSGRLVPDDRNSTRDVYVFDRATAVLTLETGAADGTSANGSSGGPTLSTDGRFLAFESDAKNLAREDSPGGRRNIFVRDRATGATRLVTAGIDGLAANGLSTDPCISADGRVIAFTSHATNLVAGSNADGVRSDVYLYLREAGTLSSIYPTGEGALFTGSRFAPALSGNGRVLAFVSTASRRPAPKSGPQIPPELDVVVVNLETGATVCVSCRDVSDRSRQRAYSPSVSADGRFVAFVVERPRGSKLRTDVVIHDLLTSVSVEITRSADASSRRPQISADGHVVVFESGASNMLCARNCPAEAVDDNLVPDIFAFDRATGVFTRVSGALGRWWTPSVAPHVDARGETVVFSSRQPFGASDPTADFDLFVCPRVCP